ncbi:MAG: ethanolamine utilization protein EutJ [Anaerolineales bacterium]|nr:ethanolamine utilization protein EutJ [Anaerolineales bacterium]
MDSLATAQRDLAQYLTQAEAVILPRRLSEKAELAPLAPEIKLRVGVDLGTTYMVLVVTDESGAPLAGEWQFAEVARDGLVVDFVGAVDLLRGMKQRVEQRIGRALTHAASGYPAGVPSVEVRATAHVVEAAGMECSGLIDEPSAANNVLMLREGAVVDVGGGTTGIAVLEDNDVIYVADEPTGGTHFTLVIAGSLGISFEEAEALKTTPDEQPRLLPLVRPVMEKVASITERHIRGRGVNHITMVGGSSAFLGMADVVQNYIGVPTQVVSHPVFVTPLGLALHDPPQ